MPAPLTVDASSEREVVIVRTFDAPAALVYTAHTTPALIQKWLLGPPGWTMPVCEFDARVGGKIKYRWENVSGDQAGFGFAGVIKEITPNRRIVHTERFDSGQEENMGGESLVTTDFVEANGVTTMTMVMRFDTKEGRDSALATGMTGGMEQSYQALDRLLPVAA